MSDSLNKRIAIGYLWNLLTKWVNRFIGLISTLVLIRLLSPADFGIVALANIVMTFFVMLAETGAEKYAIKSNNCTDELLNTAWTLNVILKLVCSLVIALSAQVVADFTQEPKLTSVMLFCSVIPLVSSLKNIGLIYYERELDYKPLMKLSAYVKMMVFPVTMLLALWWRDYWALLVGLLFQELFTVAGSYFFHSYRPRWSLNKWREQWNFSKWILLSTTSGYLRSRIDALLIGRFLPNHAVGVYRVSQEFAWLPFSELIAPATSSFYAGISKISQDRQELNIKIIQYQAMAYMLVIPSVFGICILQKPFVSVVMGQQWYSAAPIVGLLSILMLSMPLNIVLQTVLINLSKTRYLVILDMIMLVTIIGGFMFPSQFHLLSLEEYTQLRVGVVVLFISMLIAVYKFVLYINLKQLFLSLLAPALPGLLMFGVLMSIEPTSVAMLSPSINLIILVIVGIAVFVPSMGGVIWGVTKALPDYSFIYDPVNVVALSVYHRIRPEV